MRSFLFGSLIALIVHEAAHLVAARMLGVRVKRVGITWRGPYVVREPGEPVENACIALAGPVLNLLLAFVFWDAAPAFARVNLILGASNLIPIKGADGWRVLQAVRESRRSKAPVE